MTTSSPTTSLTANGHVTIVSMLNWGVPTGTGHAGHTHSIIECYGDDPVVRGTVIMRVLREQAILAAKVLDGQKGGKWTNFALRLPDQDPDNKLGSTPRPHHVLFSNMTPAPSVLTHDTVFLSIDPKTGTARGQFLRFTKCATVDILTGTFTLIDEAGVSPSDQAMIDAAHFLLGIMGSMVRSVGSGHSGGDGKCTVVADDEGCTKTDLQDERIVDTLTRILANRDSGDSPAYSPADVKTFADCLWSRVRENLQEISALPRDLPKDNPQDIAAPGLQQSEPGNTAWYETSLDTTPESPVVSYEIPLLNEMRSLDFLHGTVLVPWLHGLLRKGYPSNALVNSVIISGNLCVSDALPVYGETPGLPVPFVLEDEKVLGDEQGDKQPCMLLNRHIPISDQVYRDHTTPMRGHYIFVRSNVVPVAGQIGEPSLISRQLTAINSEMGATKDKQPFLIHALLAGLTLHASVVVSEQLLSALRDTDATSEASSIMLNFGIAGQQASLGSREPAGTFGYTRCTVGDTFARVGSTSPPVEGPVADEKTQASSYEHAEVMSLWFMSDVLVQSSALGPSGSAEDLGPTFRRANVPITVVQESPGQDSDDKDRKQILIAIRHRRVDSWSPRDNAPRATRLAIQAGSIIQARLSPDGLGALETLRHIGVGEFAPQGYGRLLVNSPALAEVTLPSSKADSKNFTTPTEAVL